MFRKFLKFLTEIFVKKTEEEEEPPIEKLPTEILGAIFAKLEYEDIQKFKNLSKFLSNAYESERWMIPGPKCGAHVSYKNKELRLYISINKIIRTIPLNQWRYFFKNAKCEMFSMIIDEEIPLEIWKTIFCCESIRYFFYVGKSINQTCIDHIAAYAPQDFRIVVDDWNLQISGSPKITAVQIQCLTNVEDVFEAMKLTSYFQFKFKPGTYKENNHSLMRLQQKTECHLIYVSSYVVYAPRTRTV